MFVALSGLQQGESRSTDGSRDAPREAPHRGLAVLGNSGLLPHLPTLSATGACRLSSVLQLAAADCECKTDLLPEAAEDVLREEALVVKMAEVVLQTEARCGGSGPSSAMST